MKRITDKNCWYGSCLRVKDINNIGIIEFDCEMYEELKKYENFMEEYGFESLDDLKEEEIIQENHILKRALELAVKQLYPEPFYKFDKKYIDYFIEQTKGE